ncbi:MAG: DUF4032 domain-containing protein, partial [Chloroflexi bacterium]|nr:DUF4032 domain-containing protein [Chloroflexota bacterium]
GYYRLLEHIETHRYLQGQEWEREFTLEEAVVQWVDQVYLPTVEVIRQTGVLEDFPERTEADLYMWIREHYWFLYQEFGDGVELQDAAQHFADHFSSKPLKRIWRWIVDRLPGHHDDPVVHKEQA